jgi:hypothetical protein
VALKLWLGACCAALATLAATSTSALADVSCSGQTYVKPFVPWLDPDDYTLVDNGALESVHGWALSGNATLAPGNEPWRVGNADDARSLLLASGSSVTSPPLCVTLLHPTLRFFAMNAGSSLVSLKVDAITEVGGVRLTTPIAVLAAGRNWQPTLPIAFLDNLVAPISGTVEFRFTPVGLGTSGWRIDDVYVDPFMGK